MGKIETTTSKNNTAAREETLAQEENLAKQESFKVYRDEMSRLLLAEYIESSLAYWDVWV
jgi:hypothetical protein